MPHYVDAGLSQAGPFIVSRHVDGLPLSELDIIDSVDATAIIDQIAKAIETLHGLGCTHGDLSPANILVAGEPGAYIVRSEEHTSELQSLMRISYAVFCLKKKTHKPHKKHNTHSH